ncbi:Thiamine pyrophosphate enzyme TPP-binding protein [Lasiodiplodia theobromae]|uniref:Thiamine pyrophosphate enzyme TPP-binding protein n=1 Tax=Lasiodiplodia theobromae TaxID=45133 RepID=UPI0015C408D6|nr:Thiamine pyrophosphate enzyme TPP-binding protein [Lasiodiplodia theobromae]KAF4541613.1 Thiamine pyrophosphate enzyme TPP-binding protein [Lasiodiplodia theobromae]
MSSVNSPLSSDIDSPSMLIQDLKQPMDVAEYLFRRLRQAGVLSVHGLPGDYNLTALDYLPKCGLEWVGNVNELNAGYAADGYARIKGISALVTTFGVGELSAINAIAGAYAECVPIVHVVGYPSTVAQKNGLLLHHSLGNGDFGVFAKMSRHISCSVSILEDAREAASLIDDAIRKCYTLSRPVYIALPTNVVQKKVDGERLKVPLDLAPPANHTEAEEYVVNVILENLRSAKNPVVLIDLLRHRAVAEAYRFVEKSGIPTFVTPMGKGAINESLSNYGGVYAGDGSSAGARERVERSDLILNIGAFQSDFNTAGFTHRTPRHNSIDFHSHGVTVRYSEHPGVNMNGVLCKLTARLCELDIETGSVPSNITPAEAVESSDPVERLDPVITHAWLWPRLGQWLRQGDVVVTETGTANFGIWGTRFPNDVVAISQVLWGSIGYATGCAQGAALAARELGRGRERVILFTGDGSFQLTAVEVSTMIRHNLNPIIFVICNHGYTIERLIHGREAFYNDIEEWDYKILPAAFGKSERFETYQVKTRDELEMLFADESFATSKKLRLVELYMPSDDAPRALITTAEAAARRNAQSD